MAYGTNGGLTAYATARGVTLTGDLDFLRDVASGYIDGAYWDRFKGIADTDEDAFPRDLYPLPVPDKVANASYEAAILYDADAKSLSSGAVSNAGSGAVSMERVDVIQVSYHSPNSDAMTDNTVLDNTPHYSVIDNLLRPYLIRWGGAIAGALVV